MRFLPAILIIGMFISSATTHGYTYSLPYQDLDGNNRNLDELQNQYVLIEIMTTWCDSCKAEMTELKEVHKQISGKITMLSIAVDLKTDTLEKLDDYKTTYDADWRFGLDYQEVFQQNFYVENYPTLIVLDDQGSIKKKWTGVVSAYDILNELDNYLDITFSVEDNNINQMTGSLIHSLIIPGMIIVIAIIVVYTVKFASRYFLIA